MRTLFGRRKTLENAKNMPLVTAAHRFRLNIQPSSPNGWAGALAFAPMTFLSSRAAGAVGF
jgi:hypothetical protein